MIHFIKKTSLFSLLSVLLFATTAIQSCKKNNDANASVVQLLSFGPSGMQLGDTISFIGNGLDKVQQIVFAGDSVSQSAFISQSSSLIRVIVPANARRGYVTLRNADGTSITSKTVLDFSVMVTITSIPDFVKPGTNITITGTHMDWVTSVVFFNATGDITVINTDFVSSSASQIVVTVPLATQTGLLTLNTGGSTPQTITSAQNLNIILPAITSFSPNPVARGSQLTITGTDLDLVTKVVLNGASPITAFDSQSATQIVVTVPQSTAYGMITVIPWSGISVVSTNPLMLVGDINPLPPLGAAIYDNAYQNGFAYGWWLGTAPDPNSTDVVRVGCTKSMKVTFDGGWSGAVFPYGNISLSSYSAFEFSVYGGPGTNGIQLQIDFNNGSDNVPFTVAEGKWTDFSLPISSWTSLGGGAATQLQIQDRGTGGVVYFDRVGFK